MFYEEAGSLRISHQKIMLTNFTTTGGDSPGPPPVHLPGEQQESRPAHPRQVTALQENINAPRFF